MHNCCVSFNHVINAKLTSSYYKTANTQDGAQLDISMNGFWGGCHEKFYTDLRVFNPLTPSNSGSSIQSCFKKHEAIKKRAYESCICKV